jgi:D-serine deaminase-like pyridoxal phosphate-dependent protein
MPSDDRVIGQPAAALETPFLAVDLDALERNIATMRRRIIVEAGTGWRPHTKAIKVPALAHRLLQAGAHGVTCAKLDEAELMASAGIRDILLANQIASPSKAARLARLLRHADIVAAVDCEAHVALLEAAAQAAGTRPRVVIEVNIGINRAGVEPGPPVLALARQIALRRGVRFAGVMGWEGQATAIPDPAEKRRVIEAAVGSLTASADLCRADGLPVEIVSCGGTGTYWITATLPGVTEVQAGGGIFSDVHYRTDYGVDHECALTVWTTVVSRPTPTRLVCDAGWKAMGRHPNLPEPRGLGATTRLTLSAEHGTIELAQPAERPRVGGRVEFTTGYSDSTVFLHDHLYGLRDGFVEVVWPILGRGKIR